MTARQARKRTVKEGTDILHRLEIFVRWPLRRTDSVQDFFAELLENVRVLGEHIGTKGECSSDLVLRLTPSPQLELVGLTVSRPAIIMFNVSSLMTARSGEQVSLAY